eukprot:jgi/Psemu1/69179/estExt_Genemark1.C_7450005
MKVVSQLGLVVFLAGSAVEAFSPQQQANVAPQQGAPETSRRELFQKAVTSVAGVAGALAVTGLAPEVALASGGATAGKYTTIPIAKRRYYGRVQQSVHEFLLLGPEIVQADFSQPAIQRFFDPKGLVVVEAKRKDVNGQCTKKNGDCKGSEVRDSIWNDMKTSMYLLANAFRLNQTKAPDNLPSVRAAKKFFKEMDLVEKAAIKKRKNDRDSVVHFAAALEALDAFLDLVELPPTDSGWYDQEFDRAVGSSARIT